MSKDKKLGRGLQDLLEQQKNASLATQQNVQEKSQEKGIDEPSEIKEPVASMSQVEESVNNKEMTEIRKDKNKEKEEKQENSHKSSELDSDNEFFHSIRKEVEEAKKDVEGLQEEISSVSTQRNAVENTESSKTPKTLIDYVNSEISTEKKEKEETVKSEPVKKTDIPKAANVQVLTVYENSEDDTDRIFNISVSLIDSNPWQPRRVFQGNEITELADSIKMHGLLQPIVLREHRNRYQLVAGERRLRAALKLNWTQVPATIIDATDREMAELALIENVQRKDLNPIEKAISFDKYLQENHCTQEELSRRLNLDRSTISNLIRLLTLPIEIQDKVVEEKITQGHARSLLALESIQDQIAMADRIEDEKLSVRQTEQVVAEWNQKPVAEQRSGKITDVPVAKAPRAKKTKSAHVMDMERQLQEALDLKVKISADDKGKGKLEIYFQNQEDFISLMDYFKN